MRNLNELPPPIPYKVRIDYIVTTIFFCWYIWTSKVGIAVQNSVHYIMRVLASIFLSKRYWYKLCRNQINAKKDLDNFYRDLEHGLNIETAKRMVSNTCTGYIALPIILVLSIVCSLIGWDTIFFWKNGIISYLIVLMVGGLIFIGLLILTKPLDDPLVYLSYFKKFEKQDEEWIKKWKRYTILLFVGGLLSAAMGICFFFFMVKHY